MGRFRRDLDMWWVQVAAYLPGRELCVERFWGRNGSHAGLRAGGLNLAIADGGWTATFDGVGQLTTTDELALAPRGSSAPVRSMRFEVTATAAAPPWDMYASQTDRLDFAGDTHIQQGFTTAGALWVDGVEYPLDGIGFKDHSSGPRDFGPWNGHRFMMIVSPEWTCHAIVMISPEGEPLPPWGVLHRDGVRSQITRFELPALADSAGGPVHGDLLIETSSGERLEFASELVHALPVTVTEDNDNINGVDWELPGDPIVLIEGKGRLTAPDGTVVHCFHERTGRRSAVSRPV
jgi:hypothetical protein